MTTHAVQQLGFDRQATLLQQTLDEEAEADKILSQLAESSVNVAAANQADDEVSDEKEVQVASSKETGSRGLRVNTSARRGPREATA